MNRLGIRLFDYPKWADVFRLELRDHAESVTKKHGLEIEFIKKKNFRKEQRIRSIVEQRGDAPGLVHIFSAVESCTAFKPWHDKTTHKTSLKPVPGKCLHYYFYFILPDLGLCYLRVPTWAPFRLQSYFNAHNELARKLDKKNIGYTMLGNAFVAIDDPGKEQKLADAIRHRRSHQRYQGCGENLPSRPRPQPKLARLQPVLRQRPRPLPRYHPRRIHHQRISQQQTAQFPQSGLGL